MLLWYLTFVLNRLFEKIVIFLSTGLIFAYIILLFIYLPSLPCNRSGYMLYAGLVIKVCVFANIVDQNCLHSKQLFI